MDAWNAAATGAAVLGSKGKRWRDDIANQDWWQYAGHKGDYGPVAKKRLPPPSPPPFVHYDTFSTPSTFHGDTKAGYTGQPDISIASEVANAHFDNRGPGKRPGRIDDSSFWKDIMSKGASDKYFGHADYDEALKRGVSRTDVLSYLDANPNVLRDKNVKGGGGLYDQISRTGDMAIGSHFGDYTLDGRKDYFGHADYRAAQAAGATDLQIQKYLQGNMGQLRGGNVQGGGGLYDTVDARAQRSRQQSQWDDFMSQYEQDRADLARRQSERTYANTQTVRDQPVMNIAPADYAPSQGASFFGNDKRGRFNRRLAKNLNISAAGGRTPAWGDTTFK